MIRFLANAFAHRTHRAGALVIGSCLLLIALISPCCYGNDGQQGRLSPLKAEGTQWVDADGKPVLLKGTNLGNWLVQEFWMMEQGGNGVHDQCTLETELTRRFGYQEKDRLIKLFRDNWIKERDFDQLRAFGFNVVRLPILWSVIEDARRPKTLRDDAWHYIDWTIAQAKKRGMYVILDLHGVHGGQTIHDHTGCSGHNSYWTRRDFQERTLWVWQQIAKRYKDEPAVAAFDPINEPWGSTAEDMAERVLELYHTIRAIDDGHIILLPSHFANIEVYNDPVDRNLTNVAFELHPYPGLFGDRPVDSHYDIHRDWLHGDKNGAGGVLDWNTRLDALNTPMLMGEFQPWQSAGIELGGKIARATYDTYASYGWASTSWAYKVFTLNGGQGDGLWGMVTNAGDFNHDRGTGLIIKASTWDCPGWNCRFSEACARKAEAIHIQGTGEKSYYLVIKSGSLRGGNLDVNYDSVSLKNSHTQEEQLANGGFGSGNQWTALSISGELNIEFDSADAGKQPGGGGGASLRFSRPKGSSGLLNGAVYQPVKLRGGQSYTLSGCFKDNGSSKAWAEIYLVNDEPEQGVDVVDVSGKLDFTSARIEDIEALFKSYGEADYDVHSGLAHWLVTDEHNDVFDYPETPTNLKLVENGNRVSLSWNSVDGDDIRYSIYRSNRRGNKGDRIASGLTQSTFSEVSRSEEQTGFYSVTASNNAAESYCSDQVRVAPRPVDVPSRIQAENYVAMHGIQVENCSDSGGGLNLGYFDPDDFVEFTISAQTTAEFSIDYRLASETGSQGFEVLIDDQLVDSQTVDPTGGWQIYVTKTGDRFTLSPGDHTLRLRSRGAGWNVNWLELTRR